MIATSAGAVNPRPRSQRSTCRSAIRPAPGRPCRPRRRRAARRGGGRRRARSGLSASRRPGTAERSRSADSGAALATSRVLVTSIGSRITCGSASPIVAVSTFSRSSSPSGWPDVHDQHPAGRESVADGLEELDGREVEGDVGLAVGVDRDHVVARVDAAQERARILVVEVQARVVHVEVPAPDLGQLGVDLHGVHARRGEELLIGARRGSGRVAEDRHPPWRLGVGPRSSSTR